MIYVRKPTMMMVVQGKVHAGRLQISRLGADQRTMCSRLVFLSDRKRS